MVFEIFISFHGNGGANRYALRIDGEIYKSFKAARIALHIGNKTIYAWLDSGKATREW